MSQVNSEAVFQVQASLPLKMEMLSEALQGEHSAYTKSKVIEVSLKEVLDGETSDPEFYL